MCSKRYYYYMQDERYSKLRDLSLIIASGLPKPRFYVKFADVLKRSESILSTGDMAIQCRSRLDTYMLECAHGICHCEAVARDAGALVFIESAARSLAAAETAALAETAVISGILHDIKRREDNHAVRGSIEAEHILAELGMDTLHRSYVVHAIKNHEAFKAICDLDDEAGCLVSNALYDADKFRWGAENFTTTLWTIVENREIPLQQLHDVFIEKMRGIEKIKETFRTETGRIYGPEIIDQGLTIGSAIYEAMSFMLTNED